MTLFGSKVNLESQGRRERKEDGPGRDAPSFNWASQTLAVGSVDPGRVGDKSLADARHDDNSKMYAEEEKHVELCEKIS